MAQPTNLFESYDMVGIREDLQDVIYDISPDETPFYTSLPEDPRFYEVAEQLYGEKAFAIESNGYRYVGNTRWHYNDGASNYHGYGVKFQFGLQPMDGDTGGLRFIPGSHKPAYQDRLVEVSPLGRRFYDTQQAWDEIDKVPCYAAEYGPRDAVAFDLRIFHGTWGGSNDRQMSCISFFHYPETPEEMETMRHIAPRYLNPKSSPGMPWNDGILNHWLANARGAICLGNTLAFQHDEDQLAGLLSGVSGALEPGANDWFA